MLPSSSLVSLYHSHHPFLSPFFYLIVIISKCELQFNSIQFNSINMKPQHDSKPPQSRAFTNPSFDKLHQILHSHTNNGWNKFWEEGLTMWDLGSPTPVLVHLNNTGSLPKGRALVPGCGSGYDVVAIASAEREVVGLDVSELAIRRAIELSSESPNADHCTFLSTDFFTWRSDQLFDLIFDHTFFCAIEPELRSSWARQISNLLKPDGELITLMFPIDDHEGGPPYKVSVSEYEKVLHPVGLKATYIEENNLAVSPRRGREMLGRWKRSSLDSSL